MNKIEFLISKLDGETHRYAIKIEDGEKVVNVNNLEMRYSILAQNWVKQKKYIDKMIDKNCCSLAQMYSLTNDLRDTSRMMDNLVFLIVQLKEI